jgi:hypothetical protein
MLLQKKKEIEERLADFAEWKKQLDEVNRLLATYEHENKSDFRRDIVDDDHVLISKKTRREPSAHARNRNR